MMVQNSEHDNQRGEMSLSDNTHKMSGWQKKKEMDCSTVQ